MSNDKLLSGRGALITGGGRGIGAAVARALASAGAAVTVSARSTDQIEKVAQELRDEGHEAHAVTCDVANPEQVEHLCRQAAELMGRVDILVNNAGIASSAPLAKESLEQWNKIFAVNVTGVFLCSRAVISGMTEAGWGRIVNVASVAGKAGSPYISTYTASKHAVVGFTRAVAVEVAKKGVTVNAVCPGYVDTDMSDHTVATITGKTGMSPDKARKVLEDMSPQGRIFTSEEVAAQVLHLCLPLSGGVNGQSLVLDGGAFQA